MANFFQNLAMGGGDTAGWVTGAPMPPKMTNVMSLTGFGDRDTSVWCSVATATRNAYGKN